MNTELTDSISQMIPTNNRLLLPEQQLQNYAAVKKCLLAAGGTYKRGGFDFTEDAETLQQRLVAGEAIDDVKKFQYFPTPPELVQRMLQLAGIEHGMRCLEPSAGQGAIALEMKKLTDSVTCVELMPQNVTFLLRGGYQWVHDGDFLKLNASPSFDRIVANPPFTNNQDIDHVLHMWNYLAPGGRLVSVMSPHHTFAESKKAKSFRDWLSDKNAVAEELPAGTFKKSGTNVSSVLVCINKQA